MWGNPLQTSRLFAREWAAAPWSVGAICPSSRRLAVQIAREVPAGSGAVIELGGGTGAVTHALLTNGVPAGRLVVVERSAAFVQHLRKRFPDVPVMHADAACLARCLPRDLGVDAIVSCLPLRSLPGHEVEAVVDQWRQVLRPGGVVIQFSYDIRPARRMPDTGGDLVMQSSRIVWANLPPARIVTMQLRAQRNATSALIGD
ncbi:class I SAM-dependent methyltransferase [Paraburkholderia susongensis]|uniref:Phospholipid N-methyltransferase n=1 Tax=Paraburkholderia susongensis TaxID=1515439 RepID=A0A1X7M5J5_9BURK|nr:methyltransferase domain-containing protein [Paraburkholderia susongensis]SMG60987.1 Phospholipid N-methyltransferase [Paraburkholderia susongensis]